MKLEVAYWQARDKLGLFYDEFDGKDMYEEVFRQHAIGALLSGIVETAFQTCTDDKTLGEVAERMECPSVVRMVDACFKAAFVRVAAQENPQSEMSANAMLRVFRETYDNAYYLYSGVADSDDNEELSEWADAQVGWLAKKVDCEVG